MNEQNINVNDELIELEEVTEDYEDVSSGLGLKIIGGVLATAGAIWGGLKLKKMIKARKEQNAEVVEAAENDDEDAVVEVVEVTEKKTKKN